MISGSMAVRLEPEACFLLAPAPLRKTCKKVGYRSTQVLYRG